MRGQLILQGEGATGGFKEKESKGGVEEKESKGGVEEKDYRIV